MQQVSVELALLVDACGCVWLPANVESRVVQLYCASRPRACLHDEVACMTPKFVIVLATKAISECHMAVTSVAGILATALPLLSLLAFCRIILMLVHVRVCGNYRCSEEDLASVIIN